MTGLDVLVVLASAQRRGAEIQGAGLAVALAQRGHRTRVVALEPGAGNTPLDVPVLARRARSLAALRALRRTIGDSVVIAHGSTALPAVAAATVGMRTRWVYRSIGDPEAWARGPLHRCRTALMLRRADRVVTLWEEAGASMRRLYGLDRVLSIPNNRPAERFGPVDAPQRSAAKAALGLDDRPVVLYLGALSPEKCPLDAIAAVARIPGSTLLVAGTGPMAPDVFAAAGGVESGRVRVLGETSDPAGLLAAADVLVLPSRTEGMPGVVIEAQMRGVPVVAAAVGAVASMVRDGVDGVVVAPGDVLGLESAVRVVLADPDRYRGRAVARAAATYGQDTVVGQWESLLTEVAGG